MPEKHPFYEWVDLFPAFCVADHAVAMRLAWNAALQAAVNAHLNAPRYGDGTIAAARIRITNLLTALLVEQPTGNPDPDRVSVTERNSYATMDELIVDLEEPEQERLTVRYTRPGGGSAF